MTTHSNANRDGAIAFYTSGIAEEAARIKTFRNMLDLPGPSREYCIKCSLDMIRNYEKCLEIMKVSFAKYHHKDE